MNPTKKMIEDRITAAMVKHRGFFRSDEDMVMVAGYVSDEVNTLYKEIETLEANVRTENNHDQYNMTVEEMRLVDYGKPLDSIKMIRQRTGMGLKEAKELMDKYRWRNGRP